MFSRRAVPSRPMPVLLRVEGITVGKLVRGATLSSVRRRDCRPRGTGRLRQDGACQAIFGGLPFDAGIVEVDGKVSRAPRRADRSKPGSVSSPKIARAKA